MREVMLVLDDDTLYKTIETEAEATGHTVQEVVVQALRQWREDVELDAAERHELAAARREWQEEGGTRGACLLRAFARRGCRSRRMRFRIEISPAGQRNLRRIPPRIRDRIEAIIYRLADDPHPRGSIKLRGEERTWRVRAGRFRILYDVYSDRLVVVVLRVVARNESTYRR